MVVVSSAVRCCSTVAEENRTIGWECEGSGGTGGDCIDDTDVLRAGGTAGAIGCTVRRHPPWGPFCAASGGAMSANWTG